jgi:F0F1-type ATP synthase assembly protein I
MAVDRRGDRGLLELWGVGLVIVACVVSGYLLGSWLDRKFGTSPWLVVAGVLLGTVAGILELFRTVSRGLK